MRELLDRLGKLPPKRLALLAAELQTRLDAAERRRNEPVAIIGMSCRFPGGADSPESYWRLLRDGVDAVTEVPSSRWDADAYYDPDPDAPGKMCSRWGGFIDGIDTFDAQFFGVAPREAATMDPQQRILLELAWEALERAGVPPDRLGGSLTGVFVGISGTDYFLLQRAAGDAAIDAYVASGTAHSVAAGRLSFVLGLQGPAVAVDTACSSSLVAVHLAVQSLRAGECRLALAGGVNAMLSPETTIALSRSRMMAPDGRCKAFDARADGFVRGEGGAVVVLKRLADARADGDPVLAVVRGTGMNHDGRSNGLTAPNGPSQEAVIRAALANAGLEPRDVTYVEAHGTGTSLGDPIEVQALGAALGPGRTGERPLLIGSVKTNIGHLESAAGIAGLVKAVLLLRNGEIPPHLHLREPNPLIAWDRIPVRVPAEGMPWPQDAPRVAGVSSFGFSGTNAHVILTSEPSDDADPARGAKEDGGAPEDRPVHVTPVTGRTRAALERNAARYARYLEAHPNATLADVAHTLGAGRAHLVHRAAVVSGSREDVRSALEAIARGDAPAGVRRGESETAPKVAFLFTGQGSQYVGMGRGLYDGSPVFRDAIDRCDGILRPYIGRPLAELLYPAEPGADDPAALLDRTEHTQPALFALEWALAELWRSWGVEPAFVAGHSVGEYVAACVAGVFELEDGLRLVAERGRLMGGLPAGGVMASVFAAESTVAEALEPYAATLSIAAVNGPESVVVSGAGEAVADLLAGLEARGVRSRMLRVSHAFHSPLMDPVLDEFEAVAAGLRAAAPRIGFVSNRTGQAERDAFTRPAYWREHLRQPVRFLESMRALRAGGCDAFVEIGPSPTLLVLGQRCVPSDAGLAWLPSLRQGRNDWTSICDGLAELYVRGAAIDWPGFDRPYARRRLVLPTYSFQRERHWIDGPTHKPAPTRKSAAPGSTRAAGTHPILGGLLPTAGIRAMIHQSELGAEALPYLADHRIHDRLVLPSPAFMELVFAAGAAWAGGRRLQVDDFVVTEPLILGTEPVTVQTVLEPDADGAAATVGVFAAGARGWRPHGRARVSAAAAAPGDLTTSGDRAGELPAIRARCQQTVDLAAFYGVLDRLGLRFGPRFRGVTRAARGDGEVLARMELPGELALEEDAHVFGHPALVDACLHLIGAALPRAGADVTVPFLLIGVDRMQLERRPGAAFWTHVRLRPDAGTDLHGAETFSADVRLFADDGSPAASLEGVRLRRAPAETFARTGDDDDDLLYEIAWHPRTRAHRDTADRAAGVPTAAGASPVAGSVLPLAESLRSRLIELGSALGMDRYGLMLPELDRLAGMAVRHALRELGAAPVPGDVIGADALAATHGIASRHLRLLRRVLEMLAEDGYLRRAAEGWEVVRALDDGETHGDWAGLRARFPEFETELGIIARCAGSLAGVLRDDVDPLQLLFPGGSLDDAAKLYGETPSAMTYNSVVAEAVAGLIGSAPPDAALRILEVGAGTGGTTARVLPRLPHDRVEYVFTDISPHFLKSAQDRFREHDFVRYALLDVARDPAAQGFEPGSFDVVVAANVLHATPDLRASLAGVRALLRPGGALVAYEVIAKERFADLTVGLTEGWWSFRDEALRPDYALLSGAAWTDLLGESGFGRTAAVHGDDGDDIFARQAVFIAEADTGAVPAALEEERAAAGSWLVLADTGGTGAALAGTLQRRGTDCVLVDAATDVATIFGQRPWAGVVDLRTLDSGLPNVADPTDLAAACEAVVVRALELVRMLAAAAEPPRLLLVTRGAQPVGPAAGGRPVGDEAADPIQAMVWGIGHTLALEHPEFRCIRVDLDPAGEDPAGDGLRLAAEILDPDPAEDQLAFRAAAPLVRRLVRTTLPAPEPTPLAADGTCLVTGGLRGLGLLVAESLVQAGARNLVLIGRTSPSDAARSTLRKLEAAGARVLVAQVDVAERADLADVLERAARSMPPLRTVIHSAGVLDDGALLQQSWSRFETVLRPKVYGAWNLHVLTRELSLDHFVIFSSGVGLLGAAGQANHAAANAFLDALAHYRRAGGLPAASINWGAWAEVGAAAERDLGAGVRPFSPASGIRILDRLLRGRQPDGRPPVQFAVLGVDWDAVLGGFAAGAEPALWAEIAGERRRTGSAPGPADAPAPGSGPGMLERLAAAPADRRGAMLATHVRTTVADVLGLSQDRVALRRPLQELGLDSLMAVELRNKLGQSLGLTLPATLLFEHPSLAELTQHLAGTVMPALPARARPAPPPAGEVQDDEGADLSEDSLAALLAEKLEEIDAQG